MNSPETIHTRRPVSDRRPCQKPRKDWGMFVLSVLCFVASGLFLYAGAVVALELGALMGAVGFGLSVGLWICGLACVGEGRR